MSGIAWPLLYYKWSPGTGGGTYRHLAEAEGHGAVCLQNEVCLLPKTDDHVRRLNMLGNDIVDPRGACVILETVAFDRDQEDKVIAGFKAEPDDAYETFIDKCDDFEREVAKEVNAGHFTYAELEENDIDLKKLQGWLAKIRKLDFYGAARAPRGGRASQGGCQAVLDAYAKRVFEAYDENS